MAILDARTETTPRGVRLYAGPKFARHSGRWGVIDDLLRVRRDGNAYVVSLGDEYISMSPAGAADEAALAAGISEHIVEPTHFGPVLDPAKFAADRMTWTLDWSKGVRVEDNGLVFPGVEGVVLGVFFNAWQDALKDDCTIDLAAKTVDLRLAKVLDFVKAAGIQINLDPETIKVTDAAAAFRYHARAGDVGDWVPVQAATTSSSNTATIAIKAINSGCTGVLIGRTALTFDLSACPLPLTAYLYLYGSGGVGTVIRLTAPTAGYTSPLTNTNNYPRIIQQTIGGDWTAIGGLWIRSPEIVAVLGSLGSYSVGIKSPYDTPANPGEIGADYSYAATGANAGYLEITVPELVPGGTSTSTSTARGRRQ